MKKENKMSKELKTIIESDFCVKSVKTFMGREGYGVNANMYYKNRRIGHIIDSGNGGCLDITYYVKVNGKEEWSLKNSDVDNFVSKLSNFDEEDMWNALIDEYLLMVDFKKAMKKIQVLHNDKVFTFTKDNKPTFLDKKYRYNGKSGVSFRTIIKDKYDGCIILNDIPTKEAVGFFKTYCIK
jgi:hypothetical protein